MKNSILKRAAGVFMAAVLAVAPAVPSAVYADSRRVVTIGADLNDSQRNSIVKYFGVDLSKVDVIYVTNQDERDHLASWVPLEQIGTHTISCAYVQPKASGGIQVKTANFNWVTSNMIASALSTSGVKNCDVIAAAPFEVSGTGALTGAIMAYEAASGQKLDSGKKDTAVQEIVTTSQVAESVGQQQATQIVNEIKIDLIQSQVNQNDSEAIGNIVNNVVNDNLFADADDAESLTDEDREALLQLAESIAAQQYNYEDVQETLERVEENVTENPQDINVNINLDNSANNSTTVNQTQSGNLDEDSILLNTDDHALGENTIIDATSAEALEDVPATFQDVEQEKGASQGEAAPFEIVTTDQGGLTEDGQETTGAQFPSDEENEIPGTGDGTVIPPAGDETVIPPAGDETVIPPAGDETVIPPADGGAWLDEGSDENGFPETAGDGDDFFGQDDGEEDDSPDGRGKGDDFGLESLMNGEEDGTETGEGGALVIGNGSTGEGFDGFALRLYLPGDSAVADGTLTFMDESGSTVARVDLSDSSVRKSAPVDNGSVLAALESDAANCVYVFTAASGLMELDGGTYRVIADVTDTAGRSFSAEDEVTYEDSDITASGSFSAGSEAKLYVAVPDGGSADISSSDPAVAIPEEGTEGSEGVRVELAEPGEAVLTATIYDGDGNYAGEESLKIVVF